MSSEIYPWDSFRNHRDLDPTLCFILSPFRPEFEGLRQVIEGVAKDLHLTCVRADEIEKSGVIHADIWEHIQRAAVIVADITDANPNVMLELGVASAIKESFRLILIVRKGSSGSVPFDIAPFRHVSYEDSLGGAARLQSQLRDYLQRALSEDATLSSVSARMDDWQKSERHHSLLLYADTVARLRGVRLLSKASPELLAYVLVSAVHDGVDVNWWAKLNHGNVRAAEGLVEMLLGPWPRGQFRAAYALQFLDENLKRIAVDEAKKLTAIPLVHDLVDAVVQNKVVDFTSDGNVRVLTESERYELLQNFTPRVRVKFSHPAS